MNGRESDDNFRRKVKPGLDQTFDQNVCDYDLMPSAHQTMHLSPLLSMDCKPLTGLLLAVSRASIGPPNLADIIIEVEPKVQIEITFIQTTQRLTLQVFHQILLQIKRLGSVSNP